LLVYSCPSYPIQSGNALSLPTSPVRQHIINELQSSQRLDNFLFNKLKGVPKSHIYRLLRSGQIRVNSGRCKPHYRLVPGDKIRLPPINLAVNTAPAKPSLTLEKNLKQAILYQDNALLVINKPAGLAVHGGSGVKLGLIEAIRQLYPQQAYWELVHRLDRQTSGCLLLAKQPQALRKLHQQLRTNAVSKSYQTLVFGHWPKNLQQVRASLVKNQLKSGERLVKASQHGKVALTQFQVLTRFNHPQVTATLVEAKPITGRTHQIRVHSQLVGHPIAGDSKYGQADFNGKIASLGTKRLFLHAYSLEFNHPISGQAIHITAPLEQSLVQLLNTLEGMQ
jgi:23S rRNA pseudouridine955/2504/2580 synthase